jgi:signal transduction histidine kinase
MKTNCEACGLALPAERTAYVCSYECTFCPVCTSNMHGICLHCGGELVRRPRRTVPVKDEAIANGGVPGSIRPWIIWALSFGVWTFVALAYGLTVFELYRSTGQSMRFITVLGMQSSQVLTYIPLTPFVFALANRYQLQRSNWARNSLILLAGGLVFTVAQVAMRGMTPYAYWDPRVHHWVSAVWDARSSQLQGQLEKARLQSLKSQLQPHFLFNTLNSISALMLTNVEAADRMITRLGDLLRISLETAGTQMTTLSRELEFVSCYIEIEKVRFEERLKVSIDVAPEALDASVPHLLLQPLVDNAIKHGISRLVSGGEIHISVTQDDADLHIEVRDNGPGFREPAHSSSGGVGLRITRERLETIYGQDQSVEVLSLPQGGVAARVCIPLRMTAAGSEQHPLAEASVTPT